MYQEILKIIDAEKQSVHSQESILSNSSFSSFNGSFRERSNKKSLRRSSASQRRTRNHSIGSGDIK